jgi:multidrug transporter EmrE-like cation transporter
MSAQLDLMAVVVIWCGMAITADLFIKKGHWMIGFLLYGLCVIPAIVTFKKQEFGWVTVAWAAISVVAGLTVSLLYFKEPLTVRRFAAAVLAIVAAYLVR